MPPPHRVSEPPSCQESGLTCRSTAPVWGRHPRGATLESLQALIPGLIVCDLPPRRGLHLVQTEAKRCSLALTAELCITAVQQTPVVLVGC